MYLETVKIVLKESFVDDVIIGGWRVVNLPLAGRVPWRSHLATDKTLRAGNALMFWRKFNGREVRSRCNSSRVLELKKVPVKKKKKRYDENCDGTE
jgi:hypothetical protein